MIPNPKNETTMHYILKCLGIVILRGLNCKFVAPEQILRQRHTDRPKIIELRYNGHKVVDALGFQLAYGRGWIMRSIEAKASRSDFKNGYTLDGADYMYLITPKGLVDKKEVANHYGLIEIDFDFLKKDWHYGQKISYPVMQGDKEGWYFFTKKPKKLDLLDWQKRNIESAIREIAVRDTTELQQLISRNVLNWLPEISSKLSKPKDILK